MNTEVAVQSVHISEVLSVETNVSSERPTTILYVTKLDDGAREQAKQRDGKQTITR